VVDNHTFVFKISDGRVIIVCCVVLDVTQAHIEKDWSKDRSFETAYLKTYGHSAGVKEGGWKWPLCLTSAHERHKVEHN